MRFPNCKGRLVAASFSGGAITFDGGAVLLRQADRMPGLADRAARSLTDTRHKASCRHSLLTMVWQRPRRVIVKPGGRAAVGVYCACGDRENRIKEQQFDVFTGRTSCHALWPHQCRLPLSGYRQAVTSLQGAKTTDAGPNQSTRAISGLDPATTFW